MPCWKLTLAYDGTAFHGWQVQPRLPTVQGTLAQALHHLTGESVLPQGSGRTDAGVHALAQVTSFSLQADVPPANLLRALNRTLPPSIRVLAAEHAPPGFHARHDALRKTYEYRIHPGRLSTGWPIVSSLGGKGGVPSVEAEAEVGRATGQPDSICPPTLAPYVWDCPWPIDLHLATQSAQAILGTHDFTSFAAVDPDQARRAGPTELQAAPANTRTIFQSCFTAHLAPDAPLLLYKVTGSGFLHHMVRNLVGTFIEIARGRPLSIPAILAARNRTAAGPTAPARGLFLHSVEYPARTPTEHPA